MSETPLERAISYFKNSPIRCRQDYFEAHTLGGILLDKLTVKDTANTRLTRALVAAQLQVKGLREAAKTEAEKLRGVRSEIVMTIEAGTGSWCEGISDKLWGIIDRLEAHGADRGT